ncbi:hypothetical protein [Sulfolobus acidocaldarius]|uniref:Conserved protein n=4 Tax=Sulfolobus acidocaldarius TaxID=2285 RepID=Q4J8T2_SULAC|nr:hypothetical protein [Sulfolobus acidocaldarius]AAY80798.1 conserved protein [Sulfolobus acidocaldarius DSM 639]AGE71397.1 hypothetical protein SacN8_07165 [Sulfolobus acidocaldarius N8]AGE73668.1 hypothetical protein SacRon12I_07165 [Sulfolobus acidocaldarius Ron12/I]ALU30359.1 hypothetical protein ATY89_10660 [Sulfolobus acidocaldarius]ALU31077.1 hypothetical protein ATZ20_02215 [Sulfolobus acidocaldarius]
MKIEDFFRNIYVQTKVVDSGDRKIVLKCYNSSTSFKWYFISPAFRSYPYTSSPLERMSREINFFTYKWTNIIVPKIIDFDLDSMCLYREYLEGREVSKSEDYFELGHSLKYIHSKGFALGDTKVENFLIPPDNKIITVIDAEQSIETDSVSHFAWDLLVTIFSISYKFIKNPQLFYEVINSFLDGYDPIKEEAKEIFDIKYISLISLIPLFNYSYLRKAIERFL